MKLGILLFAALAAAVARGAAASSPATEGHFTSAGREIRVETFAGGGANAPSIVFLHGSTGIEFANRFIAQLAQSLADQGLVVHLVHYFDRTGTVYADDRSIRDHSSQWLGAVDDAVRWVQKQRPGAPIGVFGYSLGGYLAAAEGVTNSAVGAMVVLAGGLDEETARRLRCAPPTLILHGSADNRVPLSEARRLETALKAAGGMPQIYIYPDEGHILRLGAYADVVHRSLEFFRKQLGGG